MNQFQGTARVEIVFSSPMEDPRLAGADVQAFEDMYRHKIIDGDILDMVADMHANDQVEVRFVYDTLPTAERQ